MHSSLFGVRIGFSPVLWEPVHLGLSCERSGAHVVDGFMWTREQNKKGRHAMQGLVSSLDASESTGSLVVVPGSHSYHFDALKRNRSPRGVDYVGIHGDDPLLWGPSTSRPRLVTCLPGDLVLRDSKTIHCNSPALVGDPALQAKQELLRDVSYVCMMPSRWASKTVLKARLHAAKDGVGTTHWPHEFHPMSDPTRAPPEWAPKLPLSKEQQMLVDGVSAQYTLPWLVAISVVVCMSVALFRKMQSLMMECFAILLSDVSEADFGLGPTAKNKYES